MAGPVRPAYRSREAGKEAIDVRASAPTAPSGGRWVRCVRRRRDRPTRPSCRAPSSTRGSATSGPRCSRSRTARSSRASRSARRSRPAATSSSTRARPGYQEVCTDPSYAGQVVVMTYPLIGNYGRLRDDDQSSARGCARWSWPTRRRRCSTTRASSRRCCAATTSRRSPASTRAPSPATCARTAACAASSPRPAMTDDDAAVGRCPRRRRAGRTRTSSPRCRRRRSARSATRRGGPLVAIVDFGLKANIVRSLRRRGARVRVLPAHRDAASVLAADVERRRPLARARATRRGSTARSRWRARSSTTGGRCWGSASATRSSAGPRGAETTRLRFGHHGANHPVQDLDTGYVQVTAQNHEVQVVGDSLPGVVGFRVSQINLNDRSVEGLRHRDEADRDRPVPPRGRARPARRARGVRPLRRAGWTHAAVVAGSWRRPAGAATGRSPRRS